MNLFAMRLMLVMLLTAPLLARGGGDEVVVIYNTSMPESKAGADHYAQARQGPPRQIYGVNLPAAEDIPRAGFPRGVHAPLARKLSGAGLWKPSSVTLTACHA